MPPPRAPGRSAAAADWPAWRPALKLRVRNSTNSHFGGNALAPKAPSHLSLSSNILLVAWSCSSLVKLPKPRTTRGLLVSDSGQDDSSIVGTSLRSSPPLCSNQRMGGRLVVHKERRGDERTRQDQRTRGDEKEVYYGSGHKPRWASAIDIHGGVKKRAVEAKEGRRQCTAHKAEKQKRKAARVYDASAAVRLVGGGL